MCLSVPVCLSVSVAESDMMERRPTEKLCGSIERKALPYFSLWAKGVELDIPGSEPLQQAS